MASSSTETSTPAPATTATASATPAGPVPMSFPAILRGSGGVADRFAHLRASGERGGVLSAAAPKKNRRDEKEGKRWVRRKENARFVGNPHIARPSASDLSVPVPRTRSTFPSPLPTYLARNASIPAATPITPQPSSASAGQFSLSLKGMRKELRGRGVMTEVMVREVEGQLVDWLAVGVWIDPDSFEAQRELEGGGTPVGTLGVIREVERTHMQLVWEINDDAFARYVVHCCARYHNVVSFSKDTAAAGLSPAKRLTYILRPHVTRPHQNPLSAPQGLDTPPATDLGTDFDSVGGTDHGTDADLESTLDVESDFVFSEADSDAEPDGAPRPPHAALSAIAESAASSPRLGPVDSDAEHDADVEHSDLGSDPGEDELASSVGSLDVTPRADRRIALRRRSRPWDRQRRAPSSPSGSPARRNPPRRGPRVEPPQTKDGKASFYDYLFA
ncbi:hypothetical protein PsYK624_139450 [Phanerochaete sordida]|uniref:Uncharacterized protein n=1 Tax=Phanerochaete sordida TaxID=48140 RepID=A0A9P3GP06_9APHY|nr:hypothetical protein PsYK624_139450 [Phanerochaete sordida]